MGKVIIFGIDSADFPLLEPWMSSGDLPNLKKLMTNGSYGKLRSVLPPMSPSAWTSFATGVNPGKHGIFDFTGRKKGTYDVEFINARWRKADTIWKFLSESDKKVCSIAVPMSYPPEKINGIMISGIDTPGLAKQVAGPDAFSPPELCDEIKEAVGPYLISANIFAYENHEIEKIISAVSNSISQKFDTATYLYKKEEWDCLMLMIGETDAIAHRLWRYHDRQSPFSDYTHFDEAKSDPILEVYKLIDSRIGKLLELVPDDTSILVMSDHGMGGNSQKAIYLNKWLRNNEFLTFKNEDASMSSLKEKFLASGFNQVKQLGLRYTPASIKEFILRKTNISAKLESAIRSFHIDWSKTLAFSEETPYFQNIWVNVKGQFPQGIVEPGDEYEEVRTAILEKLEGWRNPQNGEKVVKRAYRREDIYSGNCLHIAPDIIIDWNLDGNLSYMFKSTKNGAENMDAIAELSPKEMEKAKSADHRDDGMVIISGPGSRKNTEIEGAALIDLAPTILYLCETEIPENMDGKVLLAALDEEYVQKNPVRSRQDAGAESFDDEPVQGYTKEEEELIRKRLEGLGYIE